MILELNLALQEKSVLENLQINKKDNTKVPSLFNPSFVYVFVCSGLLTPFIQQKAKNIFLRLEQQSVFHQSFHIRQNAR